MKNYIRQIDIQRLAGISTILGIDLNESRARVVEVKRYGNVFNRTNLKLKVLNAFAVNLKDEASWSKKGERLKEALKERGIKTHYAVSSIQSFGVKVIETQVPVGTPDINEWIMENQEKLLRFPVASSQIVHTYETIEETEQGLKIEISFIRAEEIEYYRTFARQAGLKFLVIGIGSRDAANALSLSELKADNLVFGYFNDKELTLMKFQDSVKQYITSEYFETDDQLSGILSSQQGGEIILAGDVTHSSGHTILKPLGCSSEYTLAIGLAVKGFLPEINPASIMTFREREHVETSILKPLFQRTVIALGSIILGLLFLQFVIDYAITSKTESLDTQLMTDGSAYAEVRLLEKQVQELEQQIYSKSASTRSSNTAKFLHNIATAVPEDVWFYRMKSDQGAKALNGISIFGYTTKSEKVTEFLRRLNEKGYEVRLVRSGQPQQTETLIPVRAGIKFTTFEIKIISR